MYGLYLQGSLLKKTKQNTQTVNLIQLCFSQVRFAFPMQAEHTVLTAVLCLNIKHRCAMFSFLPHVCELRLTQQPCAY